MIKKISLKAARVNAGYSIADVCRKLNISSSAICAWENGKRSPKVNTVFELCKLYGVDYDDIYFLPQTSLKANIAGV
jgi:transcriptional regulator with XRE-family HTH domain